MSAADVKSVSPQNCKAVTKRPFLGRNLGILPQEVRIFKNCFIVSRLGTPVRWNFSRSFPLGVFTNKAPYTDNPEEGRED